MQPETLDVLLLLCREWELGRRVCVLIILGRLSYCRVLLVLWLKRMDTGSTQSYVPTPRKDVLSRCAPTSAVDG